MATLAFTVYPRFYYALINKEIDFDTDNLRLAAVTNSYTPADADDYWDDVIANELSTAGGYTANGAAVTGSRSVVAANSWAQQWVVATAYLVGQIRRPTTGNGFVYRCVVAGTSHATTEPTWPTVIGTTVVDQGVTWTCVGRNVIMLDAADLAPAWSAFSAGPFRHLVLYDRTPASDATRPLIGRLTYGSDQTGGGGDFNVTFDAGGVVTIPVP